MHRSLGHSKSKRLVRYPKRGLPFGTGSDRQRHYSKDDKQILKRRMKESEQIKENLLTWDWDPSWGSFLKPAECLFLNTLDFSDLKDEEDQTEDQRVSSTAVSCLKGPPAPPPLPPPPFPSTPQPGGAVKSCTMKLYWRELQAVSPLPRMTRFGNQSIWADLEPVHLDTKQLECLFQSKSTSFNVKVSGKKVRSVNCKYAQGHDHADHAPSLLRRLRHTITLKCPLKCISKMWFFWSNTETIVSVRVGDEEKSHHNHHFEQPAARPPPPACHLQHGHHCVRPRGSTGMENKKASGKSNHKRSCWLFFPSHSRRKQRLQVIMPTDEELCLIKDAKSQNPHSPLAPAESCLLTLGQISYLSSRLQLWAFALDYDSLERVCSCTTKDPRFPWMMDSVTDV